ncbi:MAG: hypothetical protein ABSA96_13795 [Candidatus Acidiferrales bacterium]|jgi:hypothetical protein
MAVSGVDHQSSHSIREDFEQQGTQTATSDQRAKRSDWNSSGDSWRNFDSRFTPSSATSGQDSQENTGTYQVTQVQVFSAAALLLLGGSSNQSAPIIGTNSTASAQTSPAISQASQPAGSETAVQTVTPGGTTTPASTPPVTTVPISTAPVTTTPVTTAPVTTSGSSSNTQDPLQALNSALQTLGLSQQQIQAFDQVANFIESVSPAAFADLVQQFQALAQQSSQGSQSSTAAVATDSTATPSPEATSALASSSVAPTVTAPTSTPSSPTPANSGTASSTAPPSGTYQIQELAIQFSGIDVQSNTGSTNGSSGSSGGTFDLSAFNLSIKEINVTLADGNGQTAQITTATPQANSGSSTGQTSVPSAT